MDETDGTNSTLLHEDNGAPAHAHTRHRDLLSRVEAVRYLRLDVACGTVAAGENLLGRFIRDGKIRPVRWGKSYLFSRPQLDEFVRAELAVLARPPARGADGPVVRKARQRAAEAVS
ncbi:MAG: hypothetical protein ACYSUF_00415 [Planctomycetota bacterium]